MYKLNLLELEIIESLVLPERDLALENDEVEYFIRLGIILNKLEALKIEFTG